MADVVERAVRADADAVHALVERGYRGDSARRGWSHEADLLGGQRTDLAAILASLDDHARLTLVARRAGAIIGCVEITDRSDGLAYLGLLTVDPDRQAGGLGRWLIAAAEAEAVARFGATTMEMTVIRQRGELIAYYERRGYRLTGEERPFPHGDPRFGEPRRDDLVFVVFAKSLVLGDAPPMS